jgi:metallo-beta-lactamase class B
MKVRPLITAGMVLALAASVGGQGPGAGGGPAAKVPITQTINWNDIMFPSQTQRVVPRDQEQKDPVKLFDNVYYVGVQTVSSYLITTSAGLILIDTTFPDTVDLVLNNIRKVGFDPANIKYVFSTHAANDHYGGSGRIKQVVPGVRIGMSQADWETVEQDMPKLMAQPGNKMVAFSRDLVISDGQTITLGDTTLKFYVLPGRTPGPLGIEYQARDRGKTYRAMSTGALGTPFSPKWDEPYIKSIARLKTLGPFQVWLPNHPFMVLPHDIADIEKALATRGQGPHPALVQPKVLNDYLDFITELIGRKMAIDKYQGLI